MLFCKYQMFKLVFCRQPPTFMVLRRYSGRMIQMRRAKITGTVNSLATSTANLCDICGLWCESCSMFSRLCTSSVILSVYILCMLKIQDLSSFHESISLLPRPTPYTMTVRHQSTSCKSWPCGAGEVFLEAIIRGWFPRKSFAAYCICIWNDLICSSRGNWAITEGALYSAAISCGCCGRSIWVGTFTGLITSR